KIRKAQIPGPRRTARGSRCLGRGTESYCPQKAILGAPAGLGSPSSDDGERDAGPGHGFLIRVLPRRDRPTILCTGTGTIAMPIDIPNFDFLHVGNVAELKAKGRLVVHGRHPPIRVIYDPDRLFALDNRGPHMGFPLDRGSVEDGILTCHWHHARFDLASGCTFDLWADDVPSCPVEVRDGEVWIKPSFGRVDPSRHWRRRLDDGLGHNLGLV